MPIPFSMIINGQRGSGLITPPLNGAICPPEAAARGLTRCLFYVEPTLAMVDVCGAHAPAPFTAGMWYEPPGLAAHFSQVDDFGHGRLVINRLADKTNVNLCMQLRSSKPGAFPYLSTAQPFHIEAAYYYSDNHPDHWGAFWLETAEHNAVQADCYPPDPPKFERWSELDVDEGGFCVGMMSTVHAWAGIYPNYSNVQSNNVNLLPPLDRTLEHVYGMTYDGNLGSVITWCDRAQVFSASLSGWHAPLHNQHLYAVLSAQSRGDNIPWSLTVRYLAAWIAP